MLEINLPLVVLTAVIFLGLIAVLNSILYKPLLKFIDARNDAIKNDEESASKNTSDLDVYEAQIEQLIAAARSEAGKIKQEAINAAKDAAAKIVSEKRGVLEADYGTFIQNLNAQKTDFRADLQQKLPELQAALKAKLARI
nr:F0F1 ATP synthase subunit B' [uncultured Campylobacter sp.]